MRNPTDSKPFIYRVKGDFQGADAKKALRGEFPLHMEKSEIDALLPQERGRLLTKTQMERTAFDLLVALDNPCCGGISATVEKRILGEGKAAEDQLMILSIEYLGNV